MTTFNHFFRRLLCLLLTLAMLLGVAGCTVNPAATDPSTDPTVSSTPATEPSTAPTEPPTQPTEPPTQPTEPPLEPTVIEDPNAPIFELTQADVDEYYRLLEKCEALALLGEDMVGIEATTDVLDLQYEFISAQYSISAILYYYDMDDAYLTQQYENCVEIATAANDAYLQMARNIYLSDSPAKEELFKDWTEKELEQLVAYTSRVAELQERNKKIEIEYEAAEKDDEKIKLYVELVQNNNEIAQIYGYDNYYTYAYDLVYERDYSVEEIEQMRQYVKDYLAGSLKGAYNKFYNTFYSLSAVKQYNIQSFLYNDYTTVSGNYVEKFLEVMPESFREHINTMLTSDSLFATGEGAMPGAFTTTIGDRSFCFFGPEYANCCTILHEGGHYYASRYSDLGSIPMDLAETHSQGAEWLFVSNLGSKMMADQYKALVNYRLYSDLTMILVCLMVDEFEQQVYSTDVSSFTPSDFNNLMDNIIMEYMELSVANDYITDINAYWRQVVVDQPVYYISYAVSSIAAIDLYTHSTSDFEGAVEIYRLLCEEPLEEGGFLANISAAGLAGPFEEDFYIRFKTIINSRG